MRSWVLIYFLSSHGVTRNGNEIARDTSWWNSSQRAEGGYCDGAWNDSNYRVSTRLKQGLRCWFPQQLLCLYIHTKCQRVAPTFPVIWSVKEYSLYNTSAAGWYLLFYGTCWNVICDLLFTYCWPQKHKWSVFFLPRLIVLYSLFIFVVSYNR